MAVLWAVRSERFTGWSPRSLEKGIHRIVGSLTARLTTGVLYGYGLHSHLPTRRTSHALYLAVLVRRHAPLPDASSGLHLYQVAQATLALKLPNMLGTP